VFNDAYARQATVLRVVLLAQYAATVFGSVGLLLLMTDNERASLFTQVVNASAALPLMIFLTVHFGPLGLGVAYLLSLLVNNTTELLVLYSRDGLAPFSREQVSTILFVLPSIYALLSVKPAAGAPASLVLAGLVVTVYIWFGQRFLLRSADKAALRALVT
jgi:O-antigen/teichoic acid export membrane protein